MMATNVDRNKSQNSSNSNEIKIQLPKELLRITSSNEGAQKQTNRQVD